MPETANRLDIILFLASPSDVQSDRVVVLDEAGVLSARQRERENPPIKIIRWPEDIGAGAADYPQSVINKQSGTFEIFVGLIGNRMGTPTPRANAGTEEEFDRAIELVYRGHPVQLLLFFSNIPTTPYSIDPYQLMLVRHFKDKAGRLGVLSHTYTSLDELRRLFRLSLEKAYDVALAARKETKPSPKLNTDVSSDHICEEIAVGDIHLTKGWGPQWASYHPFAIAGYRGSPVVLTGQIRTASPYFRLGFKYADCREPILSTGSIQTPGQNLLVHIGKNENSNGWFLTAYRAGIRLDANLPIRDLDVNHPVDFSLECGRNGVVNLKLNGGTVFETYFQIDGVPALTILAWGDEHDFECDLLDVRLSVSKEV
jgi:hypothetical protein